VGDWPRGCYQTVRDKLAGGEVREVNELITYNLDIRQFAQDVIEACEGPELLRAMWKAIREVTVLDPTCGSGAFLFAALNILEPVYEGCLQRMEVFIEEAVEICKLRLFLKLGPRRRARSTSSRCRILISPSAPATPWWVMPATSR